VDYETIMEKTNENDLEGLRLLWDEKKRITEYAS
jgi:hypothetical protein